MKWMKHQKNACVIKPLMVTINQHGQALFNAKAARQAIKDAEYVELFFGEENGVKGVTAIGFKFLSVQTDDSKKLKFGRKTQKGLYQVSCSIGQSVSEQAGAKKGLAVHVPLEFDPSSGFWFVDFRKKEYANTKAYVAGREKGEKK